MSTLLGYESFLVPLGASVDDVRAAVLAVLVGTYGFQVVGQTIPYETVTSGGAGPFVSPGFAFDGYGFNTITGGSPGDIIVKLNTARKITKYEIYEHYGLPGNGQGYYNSPRDWTLSYADDVAGTPGAWTVCDTRNLKLAGRGSGSVDFDSYTIAGGDGLAHRWWKFNFTSATNIGVVMNIGQIRMFTDTENEWVEQKRTVYLKPPVGAEETIGNSNGEEILGIEFLETSIGLFSSYRLKTDIPQTIQIREGTTGGTVAFNLALPSKTPFNITGSINATTLTVTATSGTITLGSQIVGPYIYGTAIITAFLGGSGGNGTYTISVNHPVIASQVMSLYPATIITAPAGAPGATAKDNLRALYATIKNSTDPVIAGWDWWYSEPAPQNADDAYDYIMAHCKTAQKNLIPSTPGNTYATPLTAGNYARAHQVLGNQAVGWSSIIPTYGLGLRVTIDLVSGFILYIQVNARGIAIATKTNTAYYGPARAYWADNAKAIATLPSTPHPRGLNPMELVIGYDGLSTTYDIAAYPFNLLVMAAHQGVGPEYWPTNPQVLHGDGSSGMILRDQFVSACNIYTYAPGYTQVALTGSGIFSPGSDNQTGNDFQIHRMVMNGHALVNASLRSIGAAGVVPAMDIQDWYRFRGTATNESLALVADSLASATLNTAMDAVTSYGSITISDASAFPNVGFAIIGNEVISYTGKTGNTLNGTVTRARYGSVKRDHWVGDPVYLGLWFTIINGGALFCGYTKPE